MSVSLFNSEGYLAPTTYGALTNIENELKEARAYRPIVYVCSPFSGDVAGNIKKARSYQPVWLKKSRKLKGKITDCGISAVDWRR